MLEIDIFEGARGTGKSTVASMLRQKTSPTPTLINFTGFHTDGEEGLKKVSKYYEEWMKLLLGLAKHDSQFVFDRFYFSEGVYSILYKDYDFARKYYEFCDAMKDLSNLGVKINIFFLTINDEEELKVRLNRDKVPFGKAEESVKETIRQQLHYKAILETLSIYYGDYLNIHTIDTSGKTSDEVYNEVVNIRKTV